MGSIPVPAGGNYNGFKNTAPKDFLRGKYPGGLRKSAKDFVCKESTKL
jgi:hypothetical protein